MKKIWRIIIQYKLYLILLIPLVYIVYYLNAYSKAMPEASTALIGNSEVEVIEGNWISFNPIADTKKDVGIIFYPGGKVAPESYAPLMQQIAKAGYPTVLVKMPFNLAIFNSDAADDIIKAYPNIKHWYIGGHSLGGTMAAQYADKHPEVFKGIFFLAAYPIENYSLREHENLRSLSFYGEKDGLIQLEEIEIHKKYLPQNQTIDIIMGGNHGQFGYYGVQEKDLDATITREVQQQMIVNKLITWLEN